MKAQKIFVLTSCLLLATIGTKAQTAAGISDDDLKRYAVTMDSVKVMQETLTQIITETVQQNSVMSVERYNQLFKLADDQSKLQEANATAEEKAFLQEVAALRQLNIGRINASYQLLAKEYVGLKAFNAIKKSIDTEEKLKTRYNAISQEVQSARQKNSTTTKGG